ncbi:MAG: AAA family ATPase, partial [Oscillospiraceae bacterium]|nr:AAA family ATPase [Oscillospiraceae bacterium]
MGQKQWDILESAYLGIFSFTQFVMWNDMRNRASELLRNKIVASLVEGRLTWEAGELNAPDKVPEDEALLPIPADASQLFAIQAAGRGESFVLHGPPGTGKSQTITALIANALAKGKTVLFVAEKMAALEVVQNRLEKIGLDPFCLELHSNKSRKRDVLDQLKKATEVTKETSLEEYLQRAEQISALRAELDDYAQALHTPQNCGMSLFQLLNRYEENKEAPELPGRITDLDQFTHQKMDEQNLLLQRLVAAARSVGHPHKHPLMVVNCPKYTQQLRMELPVALSEYSAALEDLREAGETFAAGAEEEVPVKRSDYQRLGALS